MLGAIGRGEAFLFDCLRQKKEILKERVDTFTVDWNRYLKEICGAYDSFLAMEVIMEHFEYHDTLVKKG